MVEVCSSSDGEILKRNVEERTLLHVACLFNKPEVVMDSRNEA